MKKECVIFASHIPTTDKITLGEDILIKIKKYLPNAEIFVGINPSPFTDKWIEVVKKYTHNFAVTPNHLVINSDASSYQTALRCYKEKMDNYDFIYFIHTQGTKSGRDSVRENHLRCLLYENEKVKKIFEENPQLGAYGATLTPLPNCWVDNHWDFYLSRFGVQFKNKPIRCFFVGTMFVIRGYTLNYFLESCNDDFLNGVLHNPHTKGEGDPWFFERDFIHIVDGFHNLTLDAERIINNNYEGIPLNGMTDREHYIRFQTEWKKINKII